MDSLRGSRHATVVILLTVMLDAMAGTVIIPVLPSLIRALSGGQTGRVAELFGLIMAVFYVMQFFAAPFLGALSDRFGRRPVLLLSSAALGLDFVVMALAPNLMFLIVGRIVSGGLSASVTTAYAYLVDITPAERRVGIFGMLGGAMALGQIVGPAIGGALGQHNLHAPFWLAAGLCFANTMLQWLMVPESLAPAHRATFSWRLANPVGNLVSLSRSYPTLPRWAGALTGFFLAAIGVNALLVIYTQYRYGWSLSQIGLTLMALGAFAVVVQGVLAPLAGRWFKPRSVMLAGFAVQIIAQVWLAFSAESWQFVAAATLLTLGGICAPALSAIASQLVGQREQGRLSGASMSLQSASGVVAPLIFTAAFAASQEHGGRSMAGFAFLIAAVLTSAAAAIAFRASQVSSIAGPADS